MIYFHILKLRGYLEKKQSTNAMYSVRAFARDLGIDSGSLSHFLNGKRVPTEAQAILFAERMQMSSGDELMFIKSIQDMERETQIKYFVKKMIPSIDGRKENEVDMENVIREIQSILTSVESKSM